MMFTFVNFAKSKSLFWLPRPRYGNSEWHPVIDSSVSSEILFAFWIFKFKTWPLNFDWSIWLVAMICRYIFISCICSFFLPSFVICYIYQCCIVCFAAVCNSSSDSSELAFWSQLLLRHGKRWSIVCWHLCNSSFFTNLVPPKRR
jgi:hypothetical protein